MEKRFICIEDFQKTDFALGCVGTYKQWLKTAIDWCESDGKNEYAEFLELYYVDEKLKEIITEIKETWDLKLVEYDENKDYSKYLKNEKIYIMED